MKCTFSLWCQPNLLLLTLIAMILVAVANSQGLASRLGRGGPRLFPLDRHLDIKREIYGMFNLVINLIKFQ